MVRTAAIVDAKIRQNQNSMPLDLAPARHIVAAEDAIKVDDAIAVDVSGEGETATAASIFWMLLPYLLICGW